MVCGKRNFFLVFQFSSMRRPNLLQTWPPHAKMAKGEGVHRTSSRTIKSKLFTMNGHRRPYRSLAIPNRMDPTDRNMRTSVMPHVMSVAVLPNSFDRSETVRETVKKSKASHVCPFLSALTWPKACMGNFQLSPKQKRPGQRMPIAARRACEPTSTGWERATWVV